MRGLEIFVHAVRMVFGNLGTAIRVGGVLLVVLVVLLQLAGPTYFAGADADPADVAAMYASPQGFILGIIRIVFGLWVAVAWHRYVLLEEMPGALAPAWNGSAIWSYIKAGIVFTLILIAAILPMAILGGLLVFPLLGFGSHPGLIAGFVFFVIIYLPAAYIGYRLSPMMPGAAIERPLKVREAWESTRGASGFVTLAIVTLLAGWVINLPSGVLAEAAVPLGLLWVALVQWISVMVGAAVATTIYGIHVEGRTIND